MCVTLQCAQLRLRWLATYVTLWKAKPGSGMIEDLFVDLSQNPSQRPAWSAAGQLPTLRTNSNIWHVASKRYVLPSELACCMGIPVSRSCADAAGVSPDGQQYSVKVLGNTMHVACVGTCLTVALSCVADR